MNRSKVSHHLALHLLGRDGHVLPLGVELYYDVTDPLAVTALFDDGGEQPIRWVFARDLLAEGLVQRSGAGDVVVWPANDANGLPVVHLRLCSPHGDALLEAAADQVENFLSATWHLVPLGAEHERLDLDGTIRALLSER